MGSLQFFSYLPFDDSSPDCFDRPGVGFASQHQGLLFSLTPHYTGPVSANMRILSQAVEGGDSSRHGVGRRGLSPSDISLADPRDVEEEVKVKLKVKSELP